MSSNVPTEVIGSSPIRGAIRTSISTSTESLVAGQNFSVFVTIQNPFEIPLRVHRVSTYLPTEFVDLDQQLRAKRATEIEYQIREIERAGRDVGLIPAGIVPGSKTLMEKVFGDISAVSVGPFGVSWKQDDAGMAVARDLSSSVMNMEIMFPLDRLRKSTVSALDKTVNAEEAKREMREQLEREHRKYIQALTTLQRNPSSPTVLQAGNSTTRVFTLCSRERVWFRPASYRLQLEVEYEIDGVVNVDTIEHVLPVKASLNSMIWGSIVGGLAGWGARFGATAHWGYSDLAGIGVSLVLSAMTVVLFARKKDVQPVIAVEDFWGGIAVGFLVSYSGSSLLTDLTAGSDVTPK